MAIRDRGNPMQSIIPRDKCTFGDRLSGRALKSFLFYLLAIVDYTCTLFINQTKKDWTINTHYRPYRFINYLRKIRTKMVANIAIIDSEIPIYPMISRGRPTPGDRLSGRALSRIAKLVR